MATDPLLTPYRLKHLTLKNRIMSTAHEPAYSEDGMPKDRYRLYHREKARGGMALTMTAGSAIVSPDSPEAFGNLHGHCPSGAGGALGCSAGADEVGVGSASRISGEVEQHPRPAGSAVQQTFQVMGVLNVPCCVRVARLQQRLHLIEQSGLNDGLVRARVKRALVAGHPCVVRIRHTR